jgi:phosphate-selective porin OprO and OprP
MFARNRLRKFSFLVNLATCLSLPTVFGQELHRFEGPADAEYFVGSEVLAEPVWTPPQLGDGSSPTIAQSMMVDDSAGGANGLDSQVALEERLAKLEKANAEAAAAKKKLPSVAINGVFQADAVMFSQSPESLDAHGDIQNGADFRRARLSAKGAIVENMNYFFQMDFGFFGRPTFTDIWTEFNDIPILGNVRVGQWKQPFGLETVSSFRYTTMMERSSTFQAFTPFRHLGIGFYDHSDDLNTTWAASYFRTGQDQFGSSLSTNGGNGMSARLTRLMWYECQGEQYLHVGGGYFFNSPPNDVTRFRSIPEIFVGEFVPSGLGTSGQPTPSLANGTPFFVDTAGIVDVNNVQTYGLEGLWVNGPLSLQTEAMAAIVDQSTSPQSSFDGGYATVGYFLTGEHRPYDRKAGAIDRVIPKSNFSRHGGIGAWEIAARWSYIDLTDNEIRGGTMENLTVGMNWYTNPYCKFVFNYIHSWSESPDFTGLAPSGPTFNNNRLVNNQTDAYALRCQVDF